MKNRFITPSSVLLIVSTVMICIALGGTALAVEVSIDYNLPQNETNRAHLVGDMDSPLDETQEAWPHAYGTIPCTQYTTFAPATHAATVTGIAFTYNDPGTISFEDITLSYGNVMTGASLTTNNLKATIYTPPGTIAPVQPNGYFDNTYHYIELNTGTALVEGQIIFVPFSYDFDLTADPSSNQGEGTAGPITVSAAFDPHDISSGASGYHVTYDYTTQLTVPVNIVEYIDEEFLEQSLTGTFTVTGTFVTDPFQFSHTFDYLAGDANLSGTVDLVDLTLLGQHWRGTGKDWGQGDFNGDGSVDLLDLTLLGQNWRSSMPSSSVEGLSWGEALAAVNFNGVANVPEPGTLAMILGLGMSLAGYGWLRRHR